MAEAIALLEIEAPPRESFSRRDNGNVPLEERTDVTVEELERTSLPYPAELYNGKVVFKMASPEHGILQGRIVTSLNLYLEQKQIGYAMTETNFRLWPQRSDQSRIPDIAFVRKDRLPEDLHSYPVLSPDLAIEVVSPEDNFTKVMNKVDAYLEQGSQLVWLVLPARREVLVCTPANTYSVRDVLTAPELLPGFELPVSKIFEGLPAHPRA